MASIQEYLDLIKNAIYGKDVRQAIHDGIQQCYYDGHAGSTDLEARQRLDSAEGSINSLGSRMSTAENDIDILDARVDQIVAPSGEAPSAAEVLDARTGEDGIIHDNLGDAIRSQVSSFIDSQLTNPTRVENYYCHYAGGEITHNGSYGYIEATGISEYKAIHVKTNLPNGAPSICFYKANGDWISSLKAPESSSPYLYDAIIEVPEEADIIRVSCLKSNLNSASVKTTLKEMLSGINDAIDGVKEKENDDYIELSGNISDLSGDVAQIQTDLSESVLSLPLSSNDSVNDRIDELLVVKEPTNTLNIYLTLSEAASLIAIYDGTDRIGILQISSRFATNTIYEVKNGDDLVALVLFKANANSIVSAEPITNAVFNTTRNSKVYTYFLEKYEIYNLPEYIGEHGAGGLKGVALSGNVVPVENKIAVIPMASPSNDGCMSKADKQKLDSIVDSGTINIEGSGVTKNASAYGFLPTNDGVTNAVNLQSAIDAVGGGGTILVDYAGTYEISRSIIVPSNTELIFGEKVYIKRTADSRNKFGRFMFINSGALDGTYNENIKIKGLKALPNGNLDGTSGYVRDINAEAGIRGLVVMVRIKNLVIEDFQVIDLDYVQYSAQIAFFENVRIENVRIETAKDGLHFGTGNGFIIKNCYFLTNDDPIALNAIDYPNSNVGIGDITNGIIENIYLLAPETGSGFSRTRGMLMLSGAWENWQSGNTYQKYGDVCVNNGVIYQTYAPTGPTTDTLVSTVAPTHQSGAQMYSDGLQWLAKQNINAVLSANIKNVAFRNIYVYRDVTCLFMILASESSYLRSIYPNSEQPPNENIIFENVHFLYDDETIADSLALIYNNINNIVVKDSVLDKVTDGIVFKNDYSEYPSSAKVNASLMGNYYGMSGKMFKGLSSSKKPTVTASICGSMKASGFTYSTENATVTTLASDLT